MDSLSRINDPATSAEAAERIQPQLSECQRAIIAVVRRMLATWEPPTAVEIAEAAMNELHGRYRLETLRRRVQELHRRGVLEDCGNRPCTVTFFRATTYRLTEEAQ